MEEISTKARVLSPGIAIGNAFRVIELKPAAVEQKEIDVETELQWFGERVDHIAGELSKLFLTISEEIDAKHAEIIQAQQMMITDEKFEKKVINLISEEFISVESAVERVMRGFARRLEASADEYLQERANDFIELVQYFKNRSIEKLGIPEMEIGKETILIADKLFPWIILTCKRCCAAGVLAESGTPTSHAAILARSFGIPVLISASPIAEMIRNGGQLILDAYEYGDPL